jgi:tetratricopeptide (TPR) repeat protein
MAVNNDATEWYEKGLAYYNERKYEEAIECFNKALEIDPEYDKTQVWNDIGNSFYGFGRYNDALRYYDKILELDTRYPWVWYGKGLCLHELQKYSEAIECFNKALELREEYPDAWGSKGNVFFKLKNYKEAIECYNKALEINENDANMWFNKGLALYELGEYGGALKCYDRTIEINLDDIWVQLYKARALYKLRNIEESLTQYKQTIKQAERFIQTKTNLFDSLIVKGASLRDIIAISNVEVQDNSNIPSLIEQVVDCLDQLLALDPHNMSVLALRIAVYSDLLHDHQEALLTAQAMLEKDQSDTSVRATYAEALFLAGQYEKSRQYATEILDDEQDPKYQCIIRVVLTASYLLDGNDNEGLQELDKLLNYYKSLTPKFEINVIDWIFESVTDVIRSSNARLHTKFQLLTLIDLFQGRIGRYRLSFFHALVPPHAATHV